MLFLYFYCSNGDVYHIGHILTDVFKLQSALHIFRTRGDTRHIGYNLFISQYQNWLFLPSLRIIQRITCLYWCKFIICHFQEILLPDLTKKATHVFITYYVSFSRCNTEWIDRHYLKRIINTLYKTLMHSGWNATVGMDPISSQE